MKKRTEDSAPGLATAEALVAAARRLFARHGYDATSVRAITAEAAANLGAITYHFGSKRELYDHVVESVVTPLAERVEQVAQSAGNVLDRAEAVVATYFEYFAANPDLPQLMMQELVLAGPAPAVVAKPLRRVHGALTAMIEEGQARGEVRPGAAPLLSIFILSVPVHLGMMHRTLGAHVGLNVLESPMREVIVASATEFVRNGLRVVGES